MKSKFTTYLLVIAVVAVWGVIVKRVFFSKPEQPIVQPYMVATVEDEAINDTLLLDYRDPFGAMDIKRIVAKPSTVPHRSTIPATIDVQYEPFNARFVGRINHNQSSFYIIEMNGIQHTITIGDEIEGFRLTSVSASGLNFTKNRLNYYCAF